MVSTHLEILRLSIGLVFSIRSLRTKKRQMVSDDAHFRVYRPGEILIRQGSRDQSLFIILAGDGQHHGRDR
jgi:CRP-like cAMP-binding protein